MLRTSSYTIYVDLPDDSDEMLLVHGYTGAYDRVSRRLARHLRSLEPRKAPKPLYGEWGDEEDPGPSRPPTETETAVLRARGYLTALSPDDEEAFFGRLATRLHERALKRPPRYIFMPTYDCNLRCSYCYQDHMRTDCGFQHLLTTMRPAIVDRIFAALPGIERRHGIEEGDGERRNIGFFGGEPLLAAHRPVIEHIMSAAGALGETDFWAVTNGTELEAYADLLGPDGLASLQITLDGPPDEHDRRRIYADGSGSFARIAANIDLALGRGAGVGVRLNVDRGNLAELPALAAEMVRRGWPGRPGFGVYTSPIRAGNGKTETTTTYSTWELGQALADLAETHPEVRVLGRPDDGLRGRARRLFDGSAEIVPALSPSFCSAHDRMYIFDPFGDIYACWERTGDPTVRVGRVTPEGEAELVGPSLATWRSRTVASNPVCRSCRYALHCGGGCAVLALGQKGEFHSNYCDGFQSRFRANVAEAYVAHVAGSEPAAALERVCDQ